MYFNNLLNLIKNVSITKGKDLKYQNLNLESVLIFVKKKIKKFNKSNKIIFIGNGGSSAIANHLANDFNKNAGIKALSFSDSSSITCLANDYGYENIFVKSLEFHALKGDLLFSISSSGESANILKATKYAKKNKLTTITLSGFNKNNSLRKLGDLNVYIGSKKYGHVELCHFNICHYIVDSFYS